MSFLWLPDLVGLVLKEIYCRMSKELHWSLDCFKLLTKKNMSCNSKVIIRGSRCSFMRRFLYSSELSLRMNLVALHWICSKLLISLIKAGFQIWEP